MAAAAHAACGALLMRGLSDRGPLCEPVRGLYACAGSLRLVFVVVLGEVPAKCLSVWSCEGCVGLVPAVVMRHLEGPFLGGGSCLPTTL